MILFQYREQKSTQKKNFSKHERWCLSCSGSSHSGSSSYGFGLWNSRTYNQLDKSSLLSIPWWLILSGHGSFDHKREREREREREFVFTV